MQKLKFGILVCAIVSAMACSKDEDNTCTAPPVAENIIGTWNVSVTSGLAESGMATFKNDGTFTTTPADLFISTSSATSITYKIIETEVNNVKVTMIELSAPRNSGTAFSRDVVKTNECNKIEFEAFGSVSLTR